MTQARFEFDGSRLAEARQTAGMTREGSALATRRTAETVTNWELGRATPTVETVSQLAAIYNVHPGSFFVEVEGRRAAS